MNPRRAIQRWLMAAGLILAVTAAAPARKPLTGDMAEDEKAVMDELNLARTKPAEYAKFLEEHKKRFKDKLTEVVDGKSILTKEGIPAVDEAIAFLKKAHPLPVLTGSRPLTLAARDHVKDTGPRGLIGHEGTDKSQSVDRIERYGKPKTTSGENIAYGPNKARAIVMQLIVDDGVADRGHRNNIFNSDFRLVGIGTGPHKTYGNMCVMDFADHIAEKKGQ